MAPTSPSTAEVYPEKERKPLEKVGQPKWQRIIVLSVLGYEGAGALTGGGLLIAAPDGRLMDMPVEIMHGAFRDFFIPGIILFGLGILATAAFISVLYRRRSGWILASFSLGGFAVWFWVEIAILLDLHWLHFMWGLPVLVGGLAAIPLVPEEYRRKALLLCGILSSLLYAVINIIVPTQWKAYDSTSQVVSELSAIGAPTQTLWMVLATPYTFLMIAFGWGVWKSAAGNRRLRVAGSLLIAYGALGVLWPFAPMHLRETLAAGGGTFSDTMHLALGAVTQILYLLALAFAASALGGNFRRYSITTCVVLLVFGVLTFLGASGLGKNEPTPLIGIWQRINIGVFLLWVTVLAIVLTNQRLPSKT